jgi:hypothetical protein
VALGLAKLERRSRVLQEWPRFPQTRLSVPALSELKTPGKSGIETVDSQGETAADVVPSIENETE